MSTKQKKVQQQSEDEIGNVFQILGTFWAKYSSTTPTKLKIIDSFVLYCLLITIVQFGYFILVGDFPRNSLFAGLFAPIGSLTISLCLRRQMNPETRYMNISDERTFWEYLVCMVVLFLTAINYVG